MANVVEDSLVRTLMQVNFVKTKEAFIKAQGKGYDRAKLSAEWDAYEKEQRGKMMGVLRGAVEKSSDLDEALKKRITDANTRRNHLAHAFWREQAFTMQMKEGREKMIAEPTGDADTFEKLAGDIHEAMKPTRSPALASAARR
jgi:hypothetical protein